MSLNKLQISCKNNKETEQFRFSTGETHTPRSITQVKRNIYQLALNHYLEHNTPRPNILYFKDIALKAIEEDKSNRQTDIQLDYTRIYENFIAPTFDKMMLEDIKVSDIKAWKNTLLETNDLSKSRYAKYHRVLNYVFKYAYENEYIFKNPMSLVDRKSKMFTTNHRATNNTYYTIQEAGEIMSNATGWFKVFMTTLFNTGLRTGEALALQWNDIDFEKNTIAIQRSVRKGVIKNTTKTGVNRDIDLNIPLKTLLLKYKEEQTISSEWLFPNLKTNKPYSEPKSIIRYYLKPLLKKLDIEYRTLYATRHTFATSAVENSIPITYIQRQLGHQKLSTTTDFYIKNGLLGSNGRDTRADSLYSPTA